MQEQCYLTPLCLRASPYSTFLTLIISSHSHSAFSSLVAVKIITFVSLINTSILHLSCLCVVILLETKVC